VTSIWNVHEAPAASVAPVSVTLPAVELTAPLGQLVEAFGVAARARPVPGVTGKVSVTVMPVTAAPFGFVTVMVSVEMPPESIVAGENAFENVGGVGVTVRLAVFDAAPVAACADETPLAWFGCVPATTLVTTTVTVHEPFAGP
jgi:hypothetical protein